MKKILSSLCLLTIIAILGFTFTENERNANSGLLPLPGFNVTINGCSGSTAAVWVYIHGTTQVSRCTSSISNYCTAVMTGNPDGKYDIKGDNGACVGWAYDKLWTSPQHIDVTIDCSGNGCYGPGH